MRPLLKFYCLRAREESNLQPPGPQPGVLSIELRALASTILAQIQPVYKLKRKFNRGL